MMVPPAPSFSFRVFSCQPPFQASRVSLASGLVKTSVLPTRRHRVAYQDCPVSTFTTTHHPQPRPPPFRLQTSLTPSTTSPASSANIQSSVAQPLEVSSCRVERASAFCLPFYVLVQFPSSSHPPWSLFHHHHRQPAFFLFTFIYSSAGAALAQGLLVCLSSFVQVCLVLLRFPYLLLWSAAFTSSPQRRPPSAALRQQHLLVVSLRGYFQHSGHHEPGGYEPPASGCECLA